MDGIFNVVAAVSGRTGGRPWWTLLVAGLVSKVIRNEWWLGLSGAYALIYGVALVILGVRLRSRRDEAGGATIRRAA